MAARKQFVNLPKDQLFVDGDEIKSLEQLGPLRVAFTFENAQSTEVTFRVEGREKGGFKEGFTLYKPGELARNDAFRIDPEQGTLECTGETRTVYGRSIRLPAAGGCFYRVVAKGDGGKSVTSEQVEVWRRLYYQSMVMRGVAVEDFAAIEKEVVDVLRGDATKFNIDLRKVGQTAEIPAAKTLGDATSRQRLAELVKGVYALEPYEPYGLFIVWANSVAVPVDRAVKRGWTGGDRGDCWEWRRAEGVFVVLLKESLWIDLDDDLAEAKPWFKSFTFQVKRAGSAEVETVVVDAGGATPGPAGESTRKPRMYDEVSIRVGISDPGTVTEISFSLVVVVAAWGGGFADPESNYVVIATRAFGKPVTREAMTKTLLHEVGHKLGMVPDGKGRRVDQHDHYYSTDHGHRGPHCASGVTWGERDAVVGTPTCVMFGGQERAAKRFCDDCAKALRKVDLRAGLDDQALTEEGG